MSVVSRISSLFNSLRHRYEGLSEREQRLTQALGIVSILIIIGLPMYFTITSITNTKEENEALRLMIRDLEQSRQTLQNRETELSATRTRYESRTPALGSFLEQQANSAGIELREVTDEPELTLGSFTRRRVRASLPNVELEPMMEFLEAIENSSYPVSIEKIEIDRPRNSTNYHLRVGINAYDRNETNAEQSNSNEAQTTNQRERN